MNKIKKVFTKEKDNYSYRGWLVSDYAVKRAFAVMGYNILAGILFWLIMVLLGFVFTTAITLYKILIF